MNKHVILFYLSKTRLDPIKNCDHYYIIKEKLSDANSLDEVQDVIDKYKMSFASNYIAGTRRRRRRGKKTTHRRR